MLWVVTTSFGKGRYLSELKAALEAQTYFGHFHWRIMENSLDQETRELALSWQGEDWISVSEHDWTEEERIARCPHPALLNEVIKEIQDDDLFIHISDDDLPLPRMLETLVGYFRYNRDRMVCYGPMARVALSDGTEERLLPDFPSACVVFSERISPLKQLDGNTVLIKMAALRELGDRPWPEDWETAYVCDGLMLEELAKRFKIWPASSIPILVHRLTPLSFWSNSRGRVPRDGRLDPLGRDIFDQEM